MMEITSINEAVEIYLEGHKNAKNASNQGDFKTNNHIIKNKITPSFKYLKEKNELKVLLKFIMQDNDIDLKQSTAVALLPYFENEATHALKEIIDKDLPSNSFIAKMVLKQWKKGEF